MAGQKFNQKNKRKETSKQASKRATNQPANQPANQLANQLANQPTNQTTNRSVKARTLPAGQSSKKQQASLDWVVKPAEQRQSVGQREQGMERKMAGLEWGKERGCAKSMCPSAEKGVMPTTFSKDVEASITWPVAVVLILTQDTESWWLWLSNNLNLQQQLQMTLSVLSSLRMSLSKEALPHCH